MTKEEKFVVNPLEKWFLNYSRSGAKWNTKDKPKFGIAATGWDLQMARHNQVLLIEVKYIQRAFVGGFSGLTMAPLVYRREKMKSKISHSWCYEICWAIGAKHAKRNIYQLLFDYFCRNLKFWHHYKNDLKIKYIYFVKNKKVARISFDKFLNLTEKYKIISEERIGKRRGMANKLLKLLQYN